MRDTRPSNKDELKAPIKATLGFNHIVIYRDVHLFQESNAMKSHNQVIYSNSFLGSLRKKSSLLMKSSQFNIIPQTCFRINLLCFPFHLSYSEPNPFGSYWECNQLNYVTTSKNMSSSAQVEPDLYIYLAQHFLPIFMVNVSLALEKRFPKSLLIPSWMLTYHF